MPDYVLSYFSSGGFGHEQATQQMEINEAAKGRIPVRWNVMECYGKPVGKMFTSWWNNAQKDGDVKKLHFLLKLKLLAEVVFATPIFLRTVYFLYRYNIVKVIDTQPIGTLSIVRAVAFVNLFKKKPIKIKKVLTDLPTLSEHFYSGIRSIPKSQRKIFRVHTCKPHLKKGETEEQFWQKRCHLSLKQGQIRYKPFPVRKEFLNPLPLTKVLVNSDKEKTIINKFFPSAQFDGASLKLDIQPDDEISTVLLASQSTEDAVLSYLDNITHLFLNKNDPTPCYLFLLCGKNHDNKPCLYQKVVDRFCELKKKKKIPDHLKVIPVSFQNAEVLAPLFHRTNKIFTRSSGLVTMELLTAAGPQTEIYIHCETLGQKVSKLTKELLENMPSHEKGNAYYLMKEKKARLMTPDFVEQAYQ